MTIERGTERSRWKGSDDEDINLLFSITYRTIFNRTFIPPPKSNQWLREPFFLILNLENANNEQSIVEDHGDTHLEDMKTYTETISKQVFRRILSLKAFETLVKFLFKDKYPSINSSDLDLDAILE